jgi:hypothetical protein
MPPAGACECGETGQRRTRMLVRARKSLGGGLGPRQFVLDINRTYLQTGSVRRNTKSGEAGRLDLTVNVVKSFVRLFCSSLLVSVRGPASDTLSVALPLDLRSDRWRHDGSRAFERIDARRWWTAERRRRTHGRVFSIGSRARFGGQLMASIPNLRQIWCRCACTIKRARAADRSVPAAAARRRDRRLSPEG